MRCCSASPSAGRCWPCCRRASPTAPSAGRRSRRRDGIDGAGLLALAPGAGTLDALGWVWPPLLLVLVVWMIVHARRRPAAALQPWLLYPVFGVLALTAIGGAYETLRTATDHAAAPLAGSRLIDVGGGTACTSTASAPAARPSSSNRGSASPLRRWRA